MYTKPALLLISVYHTRLMQDAFKTLNEQIHLSCAIQMNNPAK